MLTSFKAENKNKLGSGVVEKSKKEGIYVYKNSINKILNLKNK